MFNHLHRAGTTSSYGSVPMGISIWNAQNVTIADLSIGDVYDDPIEVKGDVGASSVTIYHVHLFDAGEQFIKVDPPASGVGEQLHDRVQHDQLHNGPPVTDHGGGIGYTNGIVILDGSNWLLAHNLIENLHMPDSDPAANRRNPAILIWNHCVQHDRDGNTIINCDRAIAFGPIDQTIGYDNQGGDYRNNFIYQAPGFSVPPGRQLGRADIVWDSPNSQVLFNSILTDSNSTNSIQLRWTTTGAVVDGNLADASIRVRDGATYSATENYLSRNTFDVHEPVRLATCTSSSTVRRRRRHRSGGLQRPMIPMIGAAILAPWEVRPTLAPTDSQSSTEIVPTVTSESLSPNLCLG